VYGTSFAALGKAVENNGKFCIIQSDIKGLMRLKERRELNVVSVFVTPPTLDELEKRLHHHFEDDNEIRKMVAAAADEIEASYEWGLFDLIIVNDEFSVSFVEMCVFIEDEEEKAWRRFKDEQDALRMGTGEEEIISEQSTPRDQEEADLYALVEKEKQRNKALTEQSKNLQRRILAVLGTQAGTHFVSGMGGKGNGQGGGGDSNSRWRELLNAWADMRVKHEATNAHNKAMTMDVASVVEAHKVKAAEALSNLFSYRREIGQNPDIVGVHVIKSKRFDALERSERAAREAVSAARQRNIVLRNRIRRIQEKMTQSENLGQGLHLIDFEQLNIENHSLNEKIEERSEELLKLRERISRTVQIVTHVKEKHQYLRKDNERLAGDLEEVERALDERRDHLQSLKGDVVGRRRELERMKKSNLRVTDDALLNNFEGTFHRTDELMEDLALARSEWVKVNNEVKKLEREYKLKMESQKTLAAARRPGQGLLPRGSGPIQVPSNFTL